MGWVSTVVGVGFPVYLTHKAIERKDSAEQELWLVYWAAYGCFSVAEIFTDKVLSWFPCYYHAKILFLIWLQLPNNFGARSLYLNLLRPFLLKHHNRLDRIVDGTRNDVNKFLLSHQQEIMAIKNTVQKLAITAYRAAEDAFRATRALDERTQSQPSAERAATEEASVPDFEVAGQPVEDPSWIEVSQADGTTSHRPSASRRPSRR